MGCCSRVCYCFSSWRGLLIFLNVVTLFVTLILVSGTLTIFIQEEDYYRFRVPRNTIDEDSDCGDVFSINDHYHAAWRQSVPLGVAFGAGLLGAAASILGLAVACTKSSRSILAVSYAILMFLGLGLLIAAVISQWNLFEDIKDLIKDDLTTAIENYPVCDDTITNIDDMLPGQPAAKIGTSRQCAPSNECIVLQAEALMDEVQRQGKCCGINGPEDWDIRGILPGSCCESEGIINCKPFEDGCYTEYSDDIDTYVMVLGIVFSSFVIVLLVVVLVSIANVFRGGSRGSMTI